MAKSLLSLRTLHLLQALIAVVRGSRAPRGFHLAACSPRKVRRRMPKNWVWTTDGFDACGFVESVQSCEGDVRMCLALRYALRLERKDSIVLPCFKGQYGMWEGGRGLGN